MKKNIFFAAAAFVASLASCTHEKQSNDFLSFDGFPLTQTLAGDTIDNSIDDVCVLGRPVVVKDGYLFSKYDADTFLMYFNPDTGEQISFAPKGEGPHEVNAVSGFGETSSQDGSIYVFDPYKYKLYTCTKGDSLTLNLKYSAPEEYSRYSPWQTIVLSNGKSVAPRGDYKYGMVAYDPATGAVEEWPLGYEFEDIEHPDQKMVSGRMLAYSPENGVIIETYSNLPALIMHNEDGSIKGVMKYRQDEPVSDSPMDNETVQSIAVTKNNIWLLYGKPMSEDNSHVFVYSYDGEPIADLSVFPSTKIAVDEKRRRLICTNANGEVNAIAYDIPEEISEL